MGGTGFIGYHTVHELKQRGHQLKVVARQRPDPKLWPFEVDFAQANLEECSEKELSDLLTGQEALVYNLGADDRGIHTAPAYPFFYQANVTLPTRIFKLASQLGLRCGVVCGSYFTYFDRLWPEQKLALYHPYIRSRKEQQTAVIGAAGPNMVVSVLELPYIFGAAPGRKPVWTPLLKYLKAWPVVFYTKGGTTMVGVEQVAQAIGGALENVSESGAFAVGEVNMSWAEMFERLAGIMGKRTRVITLPRFVSGSATRGLKLYYNWRGQERGLDPLKYLEFQSSYSYIREADLQATRARLKVGPGNINESFERTVKAAFG